jgi:hypothetical protein
LRAVVLSYRQFVRVFVLSIGEACREATTAPVSGGAWWRSAGKRCQVEDEAAHWRPIGLAVAWSGSRVAGSKASVGRCLVAIAGKRCQVEDEAAHWRPIGLAVAWSGSRVAGSKASVVQCLVAIAGKRCQAEDEAAHWRPIGLAVAWSGSRVAGRQRLPLAWSVSGSARWRSAGKRCQAEDEAAHWRPVGLAVAWSGCRVAGRGAQLPAVRPGLRSLDW